MRSPIPSDLHRRGVGSKETNIAILAGERRRTKKSELQISFLQLPELFEQVS